MIDKKSGIMKYFILLFEIIAFRAGDGLLLCKYQVDILGFRTFLIFTGLAWLTNFIITYYICRQIEMSKPQNIDELENYKQSIIEDTIEPEIPMNIISDEKIPLALPGNVEPTYEMIQKLSDHKFSNIKNKEKIQNGFLTENGEILMLLFYTPGLLLFILIPMINFSIILFKSFHNNLKASSKNPVLFSAMGVAGIFGSIILLIILQKKYLRIKNFTIDLSIFGILIYLLHSILSISNYQKQTDISAIPKTSYSWNESLFSIFSIFASALNIFGVHRIYKKTNLSEPLMGAIFISFGRIFVSILYAISGFGTNNLDKLDSKFITELIRKKLSNVLETFVPMLWAISYSFKIHEIMSLVINQ